MPPRMGLKAGLKIPRDAVCSQTLPAAGLLAVGCVGSVVTAHHGDAPPSPPCPQPKSLAAAPLAIFRQALSKSARILLLAVGATISLRVCGADLTPAQLDFFEAKIRPVLADSCYKCHSTLAEKVKGGLLLDSREALLKGGDNGPVLVPGDPESSLLVKAVRYTDPDLQMPKDKKLPDDQIADLVAWVKMGAPDPRSATADQRKWTDNKTNHWAWQPVRRVSRWRF